MLTDVVVTELKKSRAQFDPELDVFLKERPFLSVPLLEEHIPKLRRFQASDAGRLSDAQLQRGGKIRVEEISIPASSSGCELSLLILRPAASPGPCPGVCFFHGGGMVAGNNRTGIEIMLEWVEQLGVMVASVDYRLAPENPHPVPVEDCYATLCWVAANRAGLDIDDQPLLVTGSSAGGGLAAGVCLLARDRGGPKISDQILMYPMLDDAARFPSGTELDGEGVWDMRSNRIGWGALLGAARGGTDVPSCAAPSREKNLGDLPAAYLDVGAVEIFRDEVIDYGARLAQAGVTTELHVWAGAFHGFDVLAADTAVARAARAMRIDYLRRRLRERALP